MRGSHKIPGCNFYEELLFLQDQFEPSQSSFAADGGEDISASGTIDGDYSMDAEDLVMSDSPSMVLVKPLAISNQQHRQNEQFLNGSIATTTDVHYKDPTTRMLKTIKPKPSSPQNIQQIPKTATIQQPPLASSIIATPIITSSINQFGHYELVQGPVNLVPLRKSSSTHSTIKEVCHQTSGNTKLVPAATHPISIVDNQIQSVSIVSPSHTIDLAKSLSQNPMQSGTVQHQQQPQQQIILQPQQQPLQPSANSLYCQSLVSDLDSLTPQQTMMAKIKIQQVIFELKYGDGS